MFWYLIRRECKLSKLSRNHISVWSQHWLSPLIQGFSLLIKARFNNSKQGNRWKKKSEAKNERSLNLGLVLQVLSVGIFWLKGKANCYRTKGWKTYVYSISSLTCPFFAIRNLKLWILMMILQLEQGGGYWHYCLCCYTWLHIIFWRQRGSYLKKTFWVTPQNDTAEGLVTNIPYALWVRHFAFVFDKVSGFLHLYPKLSCFYVIIKKCKLTLKQLRFLSFFFCKHSEVQYYGLIRLFYVLLELKP